MPTLSTFRVSITPDFVEIIEGTDDVAHLIFTVTRETFGTGQPFVGLENELVAYEVIPTGDNPVDADDFLDGLLPSGELEFSFAEETRVLSFSLNNDTIEEPDETFTIEVRREERFGGPSNPVDSAEVTILDDEGDLSGPTVFRFFNTISGVHVYTADPDEVEFIQDNLFDFDFEGAVFRAASERDEEAIDVFRFLNTETGTHFYTINPEEAAFIEDNLPIFEFEKVAFRAFDRFGPDDSVPVYRFFNTETGAHFFTADEAERDIVNTLLDEFVSEGVAYYVDPLIG